MPLLETLPSHSQLLAAAPLVSLIIYLWIEISAKKKAPLPPGPKGIPLLGNIFDVSLSMWKTAEGWKDKYGPLVYIHVFGQGIVFLNNREVADDLLNHRGATYGDRPRWIVASEILTGGMMMVLSGQNPIWKRMRRASHESLSKKAITELHPIQRKESLLLLDGLMRNSENWDAEFRRYTLSSTLSLIYDLPPLSSCKDPSISEINEFTDMLIHSIYPGTHLVEFLPWLEHLPRSLAKWRRDAEAGFKRFSRLFEGLFLDVEKRIKEGDERPSFAASLIREKGRNESSDRQAAWLSATIFSGGTETTSAVLSWFLLAMIAYPEIQSRCQQELDSAVGRSRMPTFEDKERLPYIEATIREVLRWRTVFPLGVHHVTTKDDIYNGFLIPKGTICLPNVWAFHRDKSVYGKDVDEFNPARFMNNLG